MRERERERDTERERDGSDVTIFARLAMNSHFHLPKFRTIDDLQNYCLGTRRGIAADRGRPAVGFVYIPNGKLVHFIFSLWPFSSQNHAPKGPERKRNKPR